MEHQHLLQLHTHTETHTHVKTYAHICIHTHTHMITHTHTHTHTHTQTHTVPARDKLSWSRYHWPVYLLTRLLNTYKHTHTHTHTHTPTHTHTHILSVGLELGSTLTAAGWFTQSCSPSYHTVVAAEGLGTMCAYRTHWLVHTHNKHTHTHTHKQGLSICSLHPHPT